jgi:hypothetical protein
MDELRLPKLNPELVVVVPVPKLKLGAVDAAVPKEKPVLPNPALVVVAVFPTPKPNVGVADDAADGKPVVGPKFKAIF